MEDRRRAAVRHRSRRGTHRARAPGDDSHHGVEHVMSVDEAQNWRRHVGGRAGELLGVARVNGSAERIREPCKAWSKISDFSEIDAPRTAFCMNARAKGGQYTVTLRV